MPDFRRIVDRERKRRKWTVYRLAQASGVDERGLGRYLSGSGELRSDRLGLVFDALRLQVRRKGD
jgi:transcriptional regulator with XRE-family HTH domain